MHGLVVADVCVIIKICVKYINAGSVVWRPLYIWDVGSAGWTGLGICI